MGVWGACYPRKRRYLDALKRYFWCVAQEESGLGVQVLESILNFVRFWISLSIKHTLIASDEHRNNSFENLRTYVKIGLFFLILIAYFSGFGIFQKKSKESRRDQDG